jgi:hypothetical protein
MIAVIDGRTESRFSRAMTRGGGYDGLVNFRWIIIASLAVGSLASAQVPGAPTTQSSIPATPTLERPLEDLIRDLASTDQRRNDAARSELMLLSFKEIGRLRQAVAGMPITKSQVAALQEIVAQIFIANEMPKTGAGWGFMGIQMPISNDEDERALLPATIPGRVMGCDAYRVLRDGDTVVGMQGMTRKDAAMTVISNYRDLRAFLRTTAAGDWILIRAIRNGEAIEVPLQLGLNNGGRDQDVQKLQKHFADQYWAKEFAPVLKQASANPAS